MLVFEQSTYSLFIKLICIGVGRMSKLSTRSKTLESLQTYTFMLPWLVGFFAFTFGPMIASLIFSFTEYNIFSPPRFTGLDNFKEMFTEDKDFRNALVL